MVGSMEKRPYYDAEPQYLKAKTQDWFPQMEKTNQALRDLLGEYISPRSVVLEVACGGGWLAEFILKAGVKSYSGFDFSETAVKNARARLADFEEARIWRADALSPQIYTKKYNFIISHQFLQCLVGADRARWLKACSTAFYPDGVFVLSTTLGTASEAEVKAELEAAGFEVEEVVRPEESTAIFVASPVIH